MVMDMAKGLFGGGTYTSRPYNSKYVLLSGTIVEEV